MYDFWNIFHNVNVKCVGWHQEKNASVAGTILVTPAHFTRVGFAYHRNLSLKNGKKQQTVCTCAKRSALYSSESVFSQTNGVLLAKPPVIRFSVDSNTAVATAAKRDAFRRVRIIDFTKWVLRKTRYSQSFRASGHIVSCIFYSLLLISSIRDIATLINNR